MYRYFFTPIYWFGLIKAYHFTLSFRSWLSFSLFLFRLNAIKNTIIIAYLTRLISQLPVALDVRHFLFIYRHIKFCTAIQLRCPL